MSPNGELKEGIWRGDQKKIVEAREKFLTGNTEIELLPYACALYSFRKIPQCREDLLQLRELLLQSAPKLCSPGADSYYGSHWLDRMDMLSTYFAWMSEYTSLPWTKRQKVREQAISISGSILPGFLEEYYTSGDPHMHSYYLILLTYVSLQPNSPNARMALGHVVRGVRDVQDRRQRVRIYAKLGVQLRVQAKRYGWKYWVHGAGWGIRACLVPFVPLNVWMKAVASLLGVKA